jgi:lipooligosaccharide transport system permease protein
MSDKAARPIADDAPAAMQAASPPRMDFSCPHPTRRLLSVWRRNFLVWRKLAAPSMVGNLAEPLIFLFGMGLGIGAMIGEVNGVPYLNYIAAGVLAYSAMNSSSFEAMYSAFSRMHVQKTWESILNAPMTLDDVLCGEWLWAASKGMMSSVCILLVLALFGLVESFWSLLLIPLSLFFGLAFAAPALLVNAVSPSYDFFTYYFTLFITPMMMLSGLFFPVEVLPAPLAALADFLPLTHAVALARALMSGAFSIADAFHLLPLAVYAVGGFYGAAVLTRRRLLN